MRKYHPALAYATIAVLLVLRAGFGLMSQEVASPPSRPVVDRVEREPQEPELIVSQFAGEPTLDDAGNLYFVHHYFEHGQMIEADIYVAYRK